MKNILGHLFCAEYSARPWAYVDPFNAHKDLLRFYAHFAGKDIVAQRD